MKRWKPTTRPREDFALIEFSGSRISPMRNLIVCSTPPSTVLRGRVLARFAQWWDRKALAVDLIALDNGVATLEVRVNELLIATATASPLTLQPHTGPCPRCGDRSAYDLVHSPVPLLVMSACRRCSWRTSDAEYDLGRTA